LYFERLIEWGCKWGYKEEASHKEKLLIREKNESYDDYIIEERLDETSV